MGFWGQDREAIYSTTHTVFLSLSVVSITLLWPVAREMLLLEAGHKGKKVYAEEYKMLSKDAQSPRRIVIQGMNALRYSSRLITWVSGRDQWKKTIGKRTVPVAH